MTKSEIYICCIIDRTVSFKRESSKFVLLIDAVFTPIQIILQSAATDEQVSST
jgi:hypothetical protein